MTRFPAPDLRRARRAQALLVATALLLAAACGEPTGIKPDGWTLSVTKSLSLSAGDAWNPEPAVTIDADQLQVAGYVRTGYICDDVSVTTAATAGRITIRLEQTRHRGGCVAAVGEHSYVVRGALRPGTYNLRVVYDALGPVQGSITVLDTAIHID